MHIVTKWKLIILGDEVSHPGTKVLRAFGGWACIGGFALFTA